MSGKIEISRELAERIISDLSDAYISSLVSEELRAMLAAPVVERQEGCCCPPKGHTGVWAAAMCPVHFGLRAVVDRSKSEPPAPVAGDIAHDRAYRNGMMAGFQFGISGNEKGYATAIANFNSEINAAKGEVPAPVAVSVTEQELQSLADEAFRKWEKTGNPVSGVNGYMAAKAGFREGAAWATCAQLSIDKVKELNQ